MRSNEAMAAAVGSGDGTDRVGSVGVPYGDRPDPPRATVVTVQLPKIHFVFPRATSVSLGCPEQNKRSRNGPRKKSGGMSAPKDSILEEMCTMAPQEKLQS